jgi:hypothetical protein
MDKFPKTIPYSSIDWTKLRQTTENMKEERINKERTEAQKNTPWRPYIDLSERRSKQKDHTAQFREVYNMFETDLHSKDKKTSDFAQLKYGMVLKEIAGRPLKRTEIKMITIQCIQKNPKMKINAFGQLYSTKEIMGEDVYTK